MTKKCCRCKETKAVSDFYRNRSTKDGLCKQCIPCLKIIRKQQYLNCTEVYKQRALQWAKKYPEKAREYNRKKSIKRYYKKTYGDQWQEMKALYELEKEIRNEKTRI